MRVLRDFVLRALRVPPEPAIPLGSGDVQVFRASPAYYRYRLALWLLAQAAAAIGLIIGLLAVSGAIRSGDLPDGLEIALTAFETLAAITFIVQLPVTLALVHLDFEMRWYILSDRSLRIREGIVSLKEKTMTFANIQNVEIRQNPLQRILGIADVRVRSAGGGGGGGSAEGSAHRGEDLHEASFQGVDNGAEIRTIIADRVRSYRDAGLGDPDDPEPAVAPASADALAAARELRQEASLLRKALTG